jgi:two-component system response regulator FixJ
MLRASGFGVRTFQSAAALLAGLDLEVPGCVIADLQMPGLTGLELQDALARAGYALPVIFLTGHGDIPTSVRAMRYGAEDFLTKTSSRKALLDAVKRALARDAREREQWARSRELAALFDALTQREREVFDHVVQGQLNKQIAADLGLNERTVKLHRHGMMTKLHVQSVAELARLAQAAGVSRLTAGR